MRKRTEFFERGVGPIEMPRIEAPLQLQSGLIEVVTKRMIDRVAREAAGLPPEKKPCDC